MGQAKAPYAREPPSFANADEEAAFKNARNYGGAAYQPAAAQDLAHQHFGTIIVSCERADLRPMPNGVMIYQNGAARLDPLPPPSVPRAEVIDELYAAVVDGTPPLARRRVGDGDAGSLPRDASVVARRPRHRAGASGCVVSERTQTILRHWREAVPDDRLAHLVKDATRALVRALQMRLAGHKVSFGHWTFLRVLWEGDGLTQRELSDEAGVTEPTTFAALKAMERLGYIRRTRRRPQEGLRVPHAARAAR